MNCANQALILFVLGTIPGMFASQAVPQRSFIIHGTALMFGFLFWISLLLTEQSRRGTTYERALIYMSAGLLGFSLGIHLIPDSRLALYMVFLAYFHFSEFYLVSVNSEHATFDSFLLNHGKEYATAYTISMIEFHFSPIRNVSPHMHYGAIISFVGLGLRAIAMITAASGFTHLIARRRSSTHKLITHGIYAYMRHPAYCGWIIWVIGSQIILGNMICLILFSVVTWKFFSERIPYEEKLLIDFFGNDYLLYRFRTRFSGVPFIS